MAATSETVLDVAGSTGFSGVVRIDRDSETVVAAAFGRADRAFEIANTVDTRFAIASGVKGITATTIVRLVELGALARTTTARALLGADLPLIADDVTIDHLLTHRSGIGDYLDEDAVATVTDYVMPVPVHRLASTADYLEVLDGHPQQAGPGATFRYNNGGFVLLALLAERASGESFADLVAQHVCEPAGMTATAFLRSDELPGDAARGYLGDGPRTNVLHLPVRGSGDGGIYSTVADVHAFWRSLLAGRLVDEPSVAALFELVSSDVAHGLGYGRGFWLDPRDDRVIIVGYDAGVSFQSWVTRDRNETVTVMSNTTEGAWPMCRHLLDETA